jgi:peptide/nickel transport system substrate-binding protein
MRLDPTPSARHRRIGTRAAACLVAAMMLTACGADDASDASTTADGADATAVAVPTAEEFCAPLMERVEAHVSGILGPKGDRYGGTAVVGNIVEIPKGMNSLVSDDYGERQHQIYVTHMTLIRYGESLEAEPYLARDWEISEDGTELTFHLRDDVTWHDGTPTTARDVAFTYRMATDPEGGFPNAGFWTYYERGGDGVEVVDDHTVRIRLQPHQDFLDPWRALAVMPEHLLGDVSWEAMAEHPYGTSCPVGNGPFRFVEHRTGEQWTFEANPTFPEGLGGRPYLDRYVYRVIPEESTLLAEMLRGGVDVDVLVSPDRLDEIRAADGVDPEIFPFRSYVFLGWNTRREALADSRVRRALTMAIDRQEIVQAVRMGHGQVVNTPVPPVHRAFDADAAAALPYAPDRARALLAEAGFTDSDGDGTLETPSGEPFSIGILVHQNRERLDIAELAVLRLREVGIDARVEQVEWGTLLRRIMSPERDFDGMVMAWATEFRLDDRDLFHSDRVEAPFQFSGIQDPELDELMDALPVTADLEEANELWGAYQDRIVELQPFTFLYFPDRISARAARLQGVTMDARGEWVTIRDWWIPSDLRRYESGP